MRSLIAAVLVWSKCNKRLSPGKSVIQCEQSSDVAAMPSAPILNLPAAFESTQKKVTYPVMTTALGDNYELYTPTTTTETIDEWSVSSPTLAYEEAWAYHQQLSIYSGSRSFLWSPNDALIPLQEYFAQKWSVLPASNPDLWQLRTTFIQSLDGECVSFAQYIDETAIALQLTGALAFTQANIKDSKPMLANAQYVTANALHDVAGRRNYFPSSAGTSEGQATIIFACAKAFQATNNPVWRNLALSFAQAYLTYFYTQAIPANSNTIWLNHWLVNAKEPFTAKGAIAADYRNSGHFDLVVSFTAGVGQIPAGSPNFGGNLADVYCVHNGQLVWRNVYSGLVSGPNYPISYWIDQSGSKVLPDGTRSPSIEPIGRVVLLTPITATAKIVYSTYTGGVIAKNVGFDAFPIWRALRTQERNCAFDAIFWSYEAFDALYQITNDAQWLRARDATRYTIEQTHIIANLGYLFKRDPSPDPFVYPGTQLVSNHPTTPTVSRLAGGEVQVTSVAAGVGIFPVTSLQNFAVQVDSVAGVTFSCEVGSSVPTIAAIEAITDTAFVPDPSKVYRADFLLSGVGLQSRSFLPDDFVVWAADTFWYPRVAEAPIYTYQGLGGSATNSFTQIAYGIFSPVVGTLVLNTPSGGFSGGGLVLLTNPTSPPAIVLSITGGGVRQKVTVNGNTYTKNLGVTSGLVVVPGGWVGFTGSEVGNITAIEFEVIGTGSRTVQIYYAGAGPKRLPNPSRIYKTAVTTFARTAHTLTVGNVLPLNNPANIIQYQPGVVAFTVNTLGSAIDAWRGSFYSGYQLGAPIYSKWGNSGWANNVLKFLLVAQDEYTKQSPTNDVSTFAPNFLPSYWDSGVYGNANTWTWDGADPNTQWAPYSYRALVSVAEYWYLNPRDRTAQTIVMRFLGWLDRWYQTNSRPPTDFPAANNAFAGYDEPHAAALIARAAMYANLAGGTRSITFRVLKRSIAFMNTQYVASGTMAGSWAAGQPTFIEGSVTYREYFLFWHGEIITTLALLLKNKNAISYPSCSTLL